MRDLNKECTTERIEKRKSPAPGGIRSHDLSVTRHALFCCATTAAKIEEAVIKTGSQKVKFFVKLKFGPNPKICQIIFELVSKVLTSKLWSPTPK